MSELSREIDNMQNVAFGRVACRYSPHTSSGGKYGITSRILRVYGGLLCSLSLLHDSSMVQISGAVSLCYCGYGSRKLKLWKGLGSVV